MLNGRAPAPAKESFSIQHSAFSIQHCRVAPYGLTTMDVVPSPLGPVA